MSRVLLISEDYIRSHYDISDSITTKSVVTAIYEAQGFYLASVIGDKFINELYTEVESKTLTEDNKYLLDNYIMYFLGAQTCQILVSKLPYKVGNAGVLQDEKNVSNKSLVDYYQQLTGISLRRLTDYLCKHYSKYTHLLNGVEGIRAHISASDSTSIYLGGDIKVNYPVDPGRFR